MVIVDRKVSAERYLRAEVIVERITAILALVGFWVMVFLFVTPRTDFTRAVVGIALLAAILLLGIIARVAHTRAEKLKD